MSKRHRQRQREFWAATSGMASSARHPFYQRLNTLLAEEGFDEHAEGLCKAVYSQGKGRRRWKDTSAEQRAVYGNRRRITSRCGKALLRKRGEWVVMASLKISASR